MKNLGYYEFNPVIYPRKLWVYIGDRLSEICDEFDDIIAEKDYTGITYEETTRKSDSMVGVLIAFDDESSITVSNIAHETSHAVDIIEAALGIEHNGEPSAYLSGWIAKCIESAKNKEGKFIKIAK